MRGVDFASKIKPKSQGHSLAEDPPQQAQTACGNNDFQASNSKGSTCGEVGVRLGG